MSSTFKHVVITGGSSGIGLALVNLYANAGYKVSTCSRNLESLQEAISHKNVYCIKADVSVEQDCFAFIEKAIAQNGAIDILINNAGISMRASFNKVALKVLHQVMDINFWGAVNSTYAALDSVLQTKGVICNISSIAGYRGLPWRSGYSASKFALQGFSEALRTEMLEEKVHVMWVCPGFTNSNIRNVALNNTGNSQGETPLEESKLMSAEECATRIMDAIKIRKRTVVMTAQGKLTVWLNKLFPALTDKLVLNHFKKEGISNKS